MRRREEAKEIFQLAMKLLRVCGSVRSNAVTGMVTLTYRSPTHALFVQGFLSEFRFREVENRFVLVPRQLLLYVFAAPHYACVTCSQLGEGQQYEWAEEVTTKSAKAVKEALSRALATEVLGAEVI